MSLEADLKGYILKGFKSMNNFSKASKLPYTTLDSIFKRGLHNASVSNISKICDTLDISIDSLISKRKIESNFTMSSDNNEDDDDNEDEDKPFVIIESMLTCEEREHIENYRKLNDLGKKKIDELQEDFLQISKYLKINN